MTITRKKKTIVKSKSKSKSSAKVVVNVNSNNKKSRRAQPSTTNIKQPQFVPVMINPNPNHQIPQPPQDAKHLENIAKRLDEMDTKLTRQHENVKPKQAVSIVDASSNSQIEQQPVDISQISSVFGEGEPEAEPEQDIPVAVQPKSRVRGGVLDVAETESFIKSMYANDIRENTTAKTIAQKAKRDYPMKFGQLTETALIGRINKLKANIKNQEKGALKVIKQLSKAKVEYTDDIIS